MPRLSPQGYAGSDVENQGHMVPAPLIGRFMTAVARGLKGEEAGLPGLGVNLQHLSSPSARKRLRMGEKHTGVLLTHIDCTGSGFGVLKEGDVILEARLCNKWRMC